ncbi:hypothetical protein GOP47_0005500 [Adiantum capillus-veneris]|uniref:Uncharacterized protein n=1 Tax=Adiantum capillus-veneris TaxID=13818 RepID=A0A9D4ZNL8_ADICA|nr:hypothetical protein GOP47_0005500 [Adiantum capillus-veneris]
MLNLAPSKAHRSKDLLQLEHSDTSSAAGAKFLSICKSKKAQSSHPSALRTMPFGDVVGESSVLHRVQAFLPVLDEANRKLAEAIKEKGRDDYDIEVLESHETNTYVEMDLALGVADLCSDDAVSVAERLAGGQVINTTHSGIETDSDNESFHSSSEDENGTKNSLKKRRRGLKIEPIS